MSLSTLHSPDRARPAHEPAALSPEQVALFSTDRERERLAQTLHDSVCQSINGVHLLARVLTNALQAEQSAAVRQAAELCDVLKQAAGELHALVYTLKAPDILQRGLVYALEELVRAAGARLGCELHCDAALAAPSPEVSQHLYEIAREAIGNAVRHSGGTKLVVSLQAAAAGGLALTVRDDGCGFDPSLAWGDPMSGLGLARYRASLIGARLSVTSGRGEGATLTCHLSPAHV